MHWLAIAALAVVALALGGSITANPPADPDLPHHRDGGFRNNGTEFEPKGMLTLLQWQWDAWRNGLPKPPEAPTPRVEPDLGFIDANARAGAAMAPAITWIGHATMLVQSAGLNLLTDPIFSERASPVAFAGPVRAQPPGVALADLTRIDLVLISHNHYDHLDEASVRALNAQSGGPPLFVVPLGLKAWLAEVGIVNVVELDWWQSHRVDAPAGPVEVVLTPVQHWSGRTLADRMATLWGGFAVFGPDLQWFHAGDTGYSADFAQIRRRFADRQQGGGFDLALLPIGAYAPRWFMKDQHVDPAEAVQIHLDLHARRSVGFHWGTFSLSDEALDEPPRALAQARQARQVGADEFFVLAIGQTRRLPRRGEV
jgi:N-acyl-phosphatidylethanolamine-hydrolysing phospholipase D